MTNKDIELERAAANHIRGATGASSGPLQALRLLEVLWIMSAVQSLSWVPRFLSLNALPIRTRSVAV